MLDHPGPRQQATAESVLEISARLLVVPKPAEAILLVEDETRVRHVMRQVLEAAGYRVLEAKTATEAMEIPLHQGEQLMVLITDVILPDRNGVDLARELSFKFPSLKIIFISGYPENVLLRNSAPAPGGHYLAKPFSGESLLRALQHVMAE